MNHQFNEMDWPEETAVKVVKGAGDKKLAVFMDPFCVYCKKLSKETLANMNNIAIYVYLWPILGEESEEMASAILSSSNRAKALVDWMKFDQMPNGLSSEASDQILDKIAAWLKDSDCTARPRFSSPTAEARLPQ